MSPTDPNQRYDEEWRQQLAPLAEETPINPESEERVVSAVKGGGTLRRRATGSRWIRVVIQAAAAVLLVLGGAWIGRASFGGTSIVTGPRFALFLVEDSTFRGTREVGSDSLVAEYSAWAMGLRREGQLLLGEELADDQWVLGSAEETAPTARITGLFIITARDTETALGIARSCPHLRYGGGIVVRPIV